jgi:hypothetical protein
MEAGLFVGGAHKAGPSDCALPDKEAAMVAVVG